MVGPYGIDIYKYTRGDTWSVVCTVQQSGIITFDHLKHPSDANEDLVRRFCFEAEVAIANYEIDLTKRHYRGGT